MRGCSALLRGLHVQPQADQCRRRVENHFDEDVRVKNAKVRLKEISKRRKDDGAVDSQRLQDIEDAAMIEEVGSSS